MKFVNLLMNDTTYLLDEGLSKLAGIHTVQMEMEDPSWNTLSDVSHFSSYPSRPAKYHRMIAQKRKRN